MLICIQLVEEPFFEELIVAYRHFPTRSFIQFPVIFNFSILKLSKGSRDVLACIYKTLVRDDISLRRHLKDKFDYWVGHLNTILTRAGVSLKNPIFKSSNSRAFPWGEDDKVSRMIKFSAHCGSYRN